VNVIHDGKSAGALRNDQEANNFLAEVMELAAQLEGECENVH